MNFKDIITIVVLLVAIYLIFQLTKTTKTNTELLVAIASKSGVIKIENRGNNRGNSRGEEDEDEGSDKKGKPGAKHTQGKLIHRRFLSLFKDEVPKTTGEVKQLYTDTFNRKMDDVKANNTLQYMTKMNPPLLGKDKVDRGQNYWGLAEWFDEDGMMYEEYAQKVEGKKATRGTGKQKNQK